MKKTEKIIYAIFILLAIVSCSEKKKEVALSHYIGNEKILDIVFPDTISIDKNVSGKISYDMTIDTLKKSDITDRFMFLYVTTDRDGVDIHTIKKTNHKIFVDTVGNGIFDFKAKFSSTGDKVLNLVFEDVVMTNKLVEGKVPIYEEYTSISLPVFVKEE